jgi:hypothetical protein
MRRFLIDLQVLDDGLWQAHLSNEEGGIQTVKGVESTLGDIFREIARTAVRVNNEAKAKEP